MSFHRLTNPSYVNPSGFDFINALSGTPAPADGAKVGGPNNGTYFVGFGEDATTLAVNRGLKALAQNTDTLDDLFHRDLAVPTRTVDATAPGGGVSFITLTGPGVYIGVGGTPATPAGFNTCFEILDDNDNEIIVPATGARCVVTSILGGTIGTGFSLANIDLIVTPAIPAGVTYRVYYALRGNLATLPSDALTNIKIRGAQELDASFEDFRKQVSRFSGSSVAALVATVLETPDGVRLPKSSSMAFDVDPDGTVGGAHTWRFRKGRDAAAVSYLKLYDNTGFPSVDAWLERSANTVDSCAGPLKWSDANIQAAAFFNLSNLFYSLSDSSSGLYLRIWERSFTTLSVTQPSILARLNSVFYVTVGDGVNTFGDFNGILGLQNAITAFQSSTMVGGTIYLKAGTHRFSNATGPVINSGGILRIIGQSRESVTIQVNSTDGSSFNVSANNRLYLESLTIAAGTNAGSLKCSGSLHAKYVDFQRHNIQFTNPTFPFGSICRLDNCKIDTRNYSPAQFAAPCVLVTLGDAGTHGPFLFESCQFTNSDSNPVFRLKATDATHAGRLSLVRFDTCTMSLATTTDNGSGTLTGNCGVFDFDPNGSGAGGHILYADDLQWVNCKVQGNVPLGANTIVARIIPIATGGTSALPAFPGAGVGSIGKVLIRGGTWSVASSSNVTAILIGCLHLTVEDASFPLSGQSNGTHGGVEAAWVVSGTGGLNTETGGDQCAITFAPGGRGITSSLTADDLDQNSCRIRNININNIGRAVDGGELALYLSQAADVRDIRISNYFDVGSGGIPHQRVKINGWISGASGIGTKGVVEGLQLYGTNTSGRWTDNASVNYGLVILQSNGDLHLRRCNIQGFTTGGSNPSADDGFVHVQVTAASIFLNSGLTMEDCEADKTYHGFISPNNAAAPSNRRIRIIRGKYTNCSQQGIDIGMFILGDVTIQGVECSGNGLTGILVYPTVWSGSANIIGNRCFSNNGGGSAAEQIRIQGDAGQNPHGHCYNNICTDPESATPGKIFYIQNNTTIHGSVDYDFAGGHAGQTVKMRGIETNYYTDIGTSFVGRNFLRGAIMLHNEAKLDTP